MADEFLINGRPLHDVKEIVDDVGRLAAVYGRELRFGISAFVICRESESAAQAKFERLVDLPNTEIVGADKDVVMLQAVSYGKAEVGTNGGIHADLVGTAEQIAERMRAFEAIGIETFLLQFHPTVEEIERFGEQVMPLLN
jgi:alkanesulfonate monooxygenase